MMTRPSSGEASPRPLFAAALRRCLAGGYRLVDFRADLMAAIVVGIIAVPLSMALAIGTGLPPERGLITAVVAGAVAALAGGADLQVTGPTAAFVIILLPVVHQFGVGGLCLATALAGVLLLAMAVLRVGKYVRLVPHPVTLGFTGGIGLTIAGGQFKDFFGLPVAAVPDHFLPKMAALLPALPRLSVADTLVGGMTLALLLVWPRFNKKIPAALVALGVGALLTAGLRAAFGIEAVRIVDKFGYVVDGVRHAGIPRSFPLPSLHFFSEGLPAMPWPALVGALVPSAIAIALLAALESLLAAVVADGMSNRRHDSDSELLGVGLANLLAPLFGGFAATGAIARTAANIRSGARTPLASVMHAGFVLLAMLALAPVLSLLPMAAMSALLLTVAWNMANPKGIVAEVRRATAPDALVLLVTMGLTVVFDMVVGVAAGLVLSMMVFSRHMAGVSRGRLEALPAQGAKPPAAPANSEDDDLLGTRNASARADDLGEAANDSLATAAVVAPEELGADRVVVHAVEGPLFFAAAEAAFSALSLLPHHTTAVVLDLCAVSMIDASGICALEETVAQLERQHVDCIVVAPHRPEAVEALRRAGIHLAGTHRLARTRAEAVARAQHHALHRT